MDLSRELAAVPGGDARTTAASRAGARPADFDTWVGEAGPDLMRFAQAAGRNLDPADLVQDALVAVFTRWSRLNGPGQADAYARRVILNSHISRWRKWGRRVSPVDGSPTDPATSGHEAGVDDVLVARELLATLPVTHRAAVFLRFYDDLSYREIAAVIGCREATARSYVHRSLAQLKRQLDKDSLR